MIKIDGVRHMFKDANETLFFERQLESIDERLFEVKKKELVYREFIPVNNSVSAGANSYTYRQFDKVGMAKVISNFADDMPRADVFGSEFISPIKTLGASFGYNTQELRAAAMANTPLDAMKADAARRAIHEKESNVAWNGDDDSGLPGFLNNANIPVVATLTGAGGFTWALKTPDEIILDVNVIVTKIREDSKGLFEGDTLLMPIAQYNIIANTPRSSTSDTTILEFITKPGNSFGLSRVAWIADELDLAFTGETEDGIILYQNDNEVLEQIIPLEMTTLPVQERNLEFVVNVESRHGGTVVRYPVACAIMSGI